MALRRRNARFQVLLAAVFAGSMLMPALLSASQKPKNGEQVADFAFTDFAGKAHRLSDYSGHYVLLDFWATWCGLCKKEVPALKEAVELYQKRGLRILGMNSDKKVNKAKKFVQKEKIPWLQSAPQSTGRIIESELDVKWYPTIVLLDPQRRIVFVSGNGKKALDGEKLIRKLGRILPPAAQP